MSKGTFKISDTVRDILAQSAITATTVKLPEQLERQTYADVMKVLSGIGGKWSRSAGLHVFSTDPREKLGVAVESGNGLNEKKQFQAFYTPDNIAKTMCEFAGIQSDDNVLEPSAGLGAIAIAARNLGAIVTTVEINPEAAAALVALRFTCVNSDFLAIDPAIFVKFDAVLMNPPFTGDQDIRHVNHALKFLKPAGRLVAIMSPRFQSVTTKECRDFREMMNGSSIREIPSGAFSQSGTKIRTVMIRINAR